MIWQVYDQYLNFICTNPDVFSLNQSQVFVTLNNPGAPESLIDETIDKAVNSLFSVIVTMGKDGWEDSNVDVLLTCIHAGVIPIIRCPRGNAAEMIATKLDSKLRDHVMNSRANLFSNSSSNLQRPGTNEQYIDNMLYIDLDLASTVLILLDRNMDLTPMLSHSWTYQSLIHDVLEMKLNRITIEVWRNSFVRGVHVYWYPSYRRMKRSIRPEKAMILRTRITFGVVMHRIPFHKLLVSTWREWRIRHVC